MKLALYLSPWTKINFKWINYQGSLWNAEISRRKHRKYPIKYRLRQELSNKTSFTQDLRPTDKWDLIKLIRFCTAKSKINFIQKEPKALERISTSYAADRRLMSNVYKKKKTPKPNNPK